MPMSRVADAETGEALRLTHSRWSREDGRVETLRPSSLVLMGTGRLLRRRLIGTDESSSESTRCIVDSSPHAIVKGFENFGPGNPRRNNLTDLLSQPENRRHLQASSWRTGSLSSTRSSFRTLPPLSATKSENKSDVNSSSDLPSSVRSYESTFDFWKVYIRSGTRSRRSISRSWPTEWAI